MTRLRQVRQPRLTKLHSVLHFITSVGAFYAARPQRVPEILRFVKAARSSPLDRREPWWPFNAADGVRNALPANARVFEFGGGGSTLWLTDLGASVTVAEHDAAWADVLRQRLPPSAEVLTAAPALTGTVTSADYKDRYFDDYVSLVDRMSDSSLDFVIVDGRARVTCGLRAMPKVKAGGMLLLDDSNRDRYKPLVDALVAWRRVDYRGVKVSGGGIAQTTVWTRP